MYSGLVQTVEIPKGSMNIYPQFWRRSPPKNRICEKTEHIFDKSDWFFSALLTYKV